MIQLRRYSYHDKATKWMVHVFSLYMHLKYLSSDAFHILHLKQKWGCPTAFVLSLFWQFPCDIQEKIKSPMCTLWERIHCTLSFNLEQNSKRSRTSSAFDESQWLASVLGNLKKQCCIQLVWTQLEQSHTLHHLNHPSIHPSNFIFIYFFIFCLEWRPSNMFYRVWISVEEPSIHPYSDSVSQSIEIKSNLKPMLCFL